MKNTKFEFSSVLNLVAWTGASELRIGANGRQELVFLSDSYGARGCGDGGCCVCVLFVFCFVCLFVLFVLFVFPCFFFLFVLCRLHFFFFHVSFWPRVINKHTHTHTHKAGEGVLI